MKGEGVHSAAQGDVGWILGTPGVSTLDAPGDGGGTSAAHVWAVLSGRCCGLAVRSLSLGCGRFWVRFGVLGQFGEHAAGAVLVAAYTAALTCSKSTPCLYPSEMGSGCSPREDRSAISSPSFSDLRPPCRANPLLSPSCP